jgi:hypothetical protein
MKTLPERPMRVDGQTDRRANRLNDANSLRNFASMPKNETAKSSWIVRVYTNYISSCITLSKCSGYFTRRESKHSDIKHSLHRVYSCLIYVSLNKERLFIF